MDVAFMQVASRAPKCEKGRDRRFFGGRNANPPDRDERQAYQSDISRNVCALEIIPPRALGPR